MYGGKTKQFQDVAWGWKVPTRMGKGDTYTSEHITKHILPNSKQKPTLNQQHKVGCYSKFNVVFPRHNFHLRKTHEHALHYPGTVNFTKFGSDAAGQAGMVNKVFKRPLCEWARLFEMKQIRRI